MGSLEAPTDNALYYGDCLDWMRKWDSRIVDLVYLDPPFNSKQDYNMLFASEGGGDAQWRAFGDTWVWDQTAAQRLDAYLGAVAKPAHRAIAGLYRMLGECGMLAYLTYMTERLVECHRLLKPSGSIYLHCDATASHYLKVVMDAIFGAANFRSEVIWRRSQGFKRKTARKFPQKNDTILFYAKMLPCIEFNTQYKRHDAEYVKRFKKDKNGRLHRDDVNPTGGGRRTIYLDETKGDIIDSVWIDIPPVNPNAKERLGYPTQKPVRLLERIIAASSNPGDLVLDPFGGCGTTVAAADVLGRRWVGIDIDSHAIEVMLQRLGDRTIPTYGIPADYRSAVKLAKNDPFGFETWAVQRAPGFAPNIRQVADGGIDGRGTLVARPDDWPTRTAVAQVKGGKRPPVEGLRAFRDVTRRSNAAVGCYMTLDPVSSPQARADAWMGEIHVSGVRYDRMNLWTIHDHFEKRPPPLPPMNNPYTGKPMAQGALF